MIPLAPTKPERLVDWAHKLVAWLSGLELEGGGSELTAIREILGPFPFEITSDGDTTIYTPPADAIFVGTHVVFENQDGADRDFFFKSGSNQLTGTYAAKAGERDSWHAGGSPVLKGRAAGEALVINVAAGGTIDLRGHVVIGLVDGV